MQHEERERHDDERERHDVPDPSGEPKPMKGKETGLTLLEVAGLALVLGGTTYMMMGGFQTRTCGATRSSRLQWQQRQQAIEQAIEAEEGRGQDVGRRTVDEESR